MCTCHKRTVLNILYFLLLVCPFDFCEKNQIQIIHVHLRHNHLAAQSGHGEKLEQVADLDKKY